MKETIRSSASASSGARQTAKGPEMLRCACVFLRKHAAAGGVLFLLAFMALWRFAFGVGSDRYWAAAHIPLLLLLGYALYGIAGRGLGRIVFCVVFAGYLAKDFRYNRNNRAIADAARAIAEDAKRYRSAFCSELNDSELLSRVEYYSGLPALYHAEGMDLPTLLRSAEDLHDVCYIVTLEDRKRGGGSGKRLENARAELLFRRDKDMHGRKEIRVYRVPVPERKGNLPLTGEIWPNGGFEKIVKRPGRGDFPQGYDNIFNVSLSEKEVISGKYSLYGKSAGLCFVYSPLAPPPESDCTVVFSVARAPGAKVGFHIWKFDGKGKFLSRKIMLNAILPADGRTHQFQMPFHAADFRDAASIRCYWYLVAPHGLLLDDLGIFR